MNFKVSIMCNVLEVDRSSYYHWEQQKYRTKKRDEKLSKLIKEIFVKSRRNYGTRRIKERLEKAQGVLVSRRRIGTIMRELGLKAKATKKYKVSTTDSNHQLPVSPNIVNRDFSSSKVDEKYVGDITYIPTKEGWLYLATVIDLYSRKVVGWSMADNMKASLVNDALNMAITRRKPAKGLIWHTDRGSQYASISHRKLIHENGIIQSMSRKGNCWDNAVAESFFHTLKTELIYDEIYETKAQANQSIFEYIEVYYNKQRIHSANNYLSPVEFENAMLLNETVA